MSLESSNQRVDYEQNPNTLRNKGINAKLSPKYDNLYVVTAMSSPLIATLEEEGDRKTRQTHMVDLKAYVSGKIGDRAGGTSIIQR
jgi:hypothetical protein